MDDKDRDRDGGKEQQQERDAVILLKHIEELAILKFNSEEKREQSLIQQSSQMQTVFSFLTAAFFMALVIIIQNRGRLSLNFFLVSSTIIIAFLLVSLVTASIAQFRWKTKSFSDIEETFKFVSNNWQTSYKESEQRKQKVDLLAEVQKDKARLNGRRVKLVMTSMISFYIAIGFIVICFIIGVSKLT